MYRVSFRKVRQNFGSMDARLVLPPPRRGVVRWQGEFTCARDCFYSYATSACEEIERGLTAAVSVSGATNLVRQPPQVGLTTDEASWAVRATFGAASLGLRECDIRCTRHSVYITIDLSRLR